MIDSTGTCGHDRPFASMAAETTGFVLWTRYVSHKHLGGKGRYDYEKGGEGIRCDGWGVGREAIRRGYRKGEGRGYGYGGGGAGYVKEGEGGAKFSAMGGEVCPIPCMAAVVPIGRRTPIRRGTRYLRIFGGGLEQVTTGCGGSQP